MINSRPLIGQPSFTTKASTHPPYPPFFCLKAPWWRRRGGGDGDEEGRGGGRIFFFFFFFGVKAPWRRRRRWRQGGIKKCLKASWQRCYYPHRSRDALSPVCGIFFFFLQKKMLSAPFLTPAETKMLVLLSASVERFGVSRMRDFYLAVCFLIETAILFLAFLLILCK